MSAPTPEVDPGRALAEWALANGDAEAWEARPLVELAPGYWGTELPETLVWEGDQA